jgi:phosphoglycolate phosphatase-like HAD superfamily hydrolase
MNPTERSRLEQAQTLLTAAGANEDDRRRALGIIKNLLAARTAATEEKRLRKAVEELAAVNVACLAALDELLSHPAPTPEARERRGSKIAQITNALELETDRALYFGLQMPFNRQKPFKRRALKQYGREPKTPLTEGVLKMAVALENVFRSEKVCVPCGAKREPGGEYKHADGCPVVFWTGEIK